MIDSKIKIWMLFSIFSFLVSYPDDASAYFYSKDHSVIGSIKIYRIKNNESLIEIGRQFDLGYNAITDANPGLDPFIPETGSEVTIPNYWILPNMPAKTGIVINLSELRLYYFMTQGGRSEVKTFPIGIGSEGDEIPLGNYRVSEKLVKPAWHVPASIKMEKPFLPDVVPPGPDNPLGSYALRLSNSTFLIHGTNKPWGVGRKVSHGCIRLYSEDIPTLFKLAANETHVTIVRQPVKIGLVNHQVYIEVHEDKQSKILYLDESLRFLKQKKLLEFVDRNKLKNAVTEKKGYPVNISLALPGK